MAINSFIDKIKPNNPLFRLADGIDIGYLSSVAGFGYENSDDAINELARRTYASQNDNTDPTGFIDLNATLTVIDATRVFTFHALSGGSSFYIKGKKFTITTDKTITLSNTEGKHFIYFGNDGELHEILNFDANTLLFNNAYVSYMIYNATDSIFTLRPALEMHGANFPKSLHRYLHENFGTRYNDGLTIGNVVDVINPTDAQNQISVTSGLISDEGIRITILEKLATSTMKVFFRSGINDIRNITSAFPVIGKNDVSITTRIKYNSVSSGSYSLSELDNNKIMLTFIIATNSIADPLIAWIGSQQYNNDTEAYNNAYQEIDALKSVIPLEEMVVIGALIVQTSSYTNTTNARFVSTPSGGNYIDLRQIRNSNYGSAVTQLHNNLLNRDSANSHTATAVSLNTTNFNKNLPITVTDVQKLADAVDDLTIGGGSIIKLYYFSSTSNALTLSVIKGGLSTYQNVTDFIYTNNDLLLNAPSVAGNYYLYCIVPEGTNVDRILYDISGVFTNILSTPVGQIIADGINHNVYVSQNTMALTTTTKTVRFVVYPATISYVETYVPQLNELIMNNGQRNRAVGSGIFLNAGLIPNNKVEQGVSGIQTVPITVGATTQHLELETSQAWNGVKNKRIIVNMTDNLSQFYLNLPHLPTTTSQDGSPLAINDFIQIVDITNYSLYPQARWFVDTFSISEVFESGVTRLTPTTRRIYQFTYNGLNRNQQKFWAEDNFAYGNSGSPYDVQTTYTTEQLLYRDFTDKTLNVNGNFDVVQGTKLDENTLVLNSLTVLKPTASSLSLTFTNRYNMVQTLYKHLSIVDKSYPNYIKNEIMQTLDISNALGYINDTVMNLNYASGGLDEPISDQDVDITQITLQDTGIVVFRMDTSNTPINISVGGLITLASHTGENVFNPSRPFTISSITNLSGYSNIVASFDSINQVIVNEGNGESIVAYFKRRLFLSTSSFSDVNNNWNITFNYYVNQARTILAVVQDNWWMNTYAYNWFGGDFTNAIDTNGDFSATGDINNNGNITSQGIIGGANMKLGNKLLANTTTPSNNHDVMAYNTTTGQWGIEQPFIPTNVLLSTPQNYNSLPVNIGSTANQTVTMTAFNERFLTTDDVATETVNNVFGLGTLPNIYGGGVMSDNGLGVAFYNGTGYSIKRTLADNITDFSNLFTNYSGVAYCSCTNGEDILTLSPSTASNYFTLSRYTVNGTLYSSFGGVGTRTNIGGNPQLVAMSPDTSKVAVFNASSGNSIYQVFNVGGWDNQYTSLNSAYTVNSSSVTTNNAVSILLVNDGAMIGLNPNGDLFKINTDSTFSILANNFVGMNGIGKARLGIKMISSTVYIVAMGNNGDVSTFNYTGGIILKKYEAIIGMNLPVMVGIDNNLNVIGVAFNQLQTNVSSSKYLSEIVIQMLKPTTFESGIRDSSSSVGLELQQLVRTSTGSGFAWKQDRPITSLSTTTTLNYNQRYITTTQSSAMTLTLPNPSTFPQSEMELEFEIQNSGVGAVTVQCPSGLTFNNGTNLSTHVLQASQYMSFILRRSGVSGNKIIPNFRAEIGSSIRYTANTTQNILSGTDTTVLYTNADSTQSTNSGLVGISYNSANGVFTNTSGKTIEVRVEYQTSFTTINTTGVRVGYLRLNGTDTSRFANSFDNAVTSDISVSNESYTLTLQNNDYFDIRCYHTSSTSSLVISGAGGGMLQGNTTYIKLTRVS